ncbi:MAG: SH3 domain-containing protein [Clostridiales bacterium]|nr:SH3 domain-containing protein [Clostridiales bacterium]
MADHDRFCLHCGYPREQNFTNNTNSGNSRVPLNAQRIVPNTGTPEQTGDVTISLYDNRNGGITPTVGQNYNAGSGFIPDDYREKTIGLNSYPNNRWNGDVTVSEVTGVGNTGGQVIVLNNENKKSKKNIAIIILISVLCLIVVAAIVVLYFLVGDRKTIFRKEDDNSKTTKAVESTTYVSTLPTEDDFLDAIGTIEKITGKDITCSKPKNDSVGNCYTFSLLMNGDEIAKCKILLPESKQDLDYGHVTGIEVSCPGSYDKKLSEDENIRLALSCGVLPLAVYNNLTGGEEIKDSSDVIDFIDSFDFKEITVETGDTWYRYTNTIEDISYTIYINPKNLYVLAECGDNYYESMVEGNADSTPIAEAFETEETTTEETTTKKEDDNTTKVYQLDTSGTVNSNRVRVRKGPSTEYSILVHKGKKILLDEYDWVNIIEKVETQDKENPNWYHIKFEIDGTELEGYIAAEYVDRVGTH